MAARGAPRHVVLVGATSAIATRCARLWVEREPLRVTLVGRDEALLTRLAADLTTRAPHSPVEVVTTSFVDPQAIGQAVARIVARGVPDTVLIAQGSLPDQESGQRDPAHAWHSLQLNALSPVCFAEGFVAAMLAARRGTIAIIGSVAGDRGRASNYLYGAAKGLLERYCEGLRHRLATSGVRVVLLKPGPTDTPMTAHLKAHGARLAPLSQVAEAAVAAIDAGRAVAYLPARWRYIMWTLRALPAFIFHRLPI
jgi:short-subunit dehydrogenase